MDEQLFREESQKLLVYLATETILDPDEKNVSLSYLNPLPINAIITDLSAGRIIYKLPGILTEKAKIVICEKKHRPLLEMSYKLKVLGETDYYEGYKVNGKFQIFELDKDYIRLYIFIKQLSD